MVPRPHPEVLGERIGDSLVLVHLGTNGMVELNATAARLWDLLGQGAGREAILDTLTAEFEIDRRQAAAEVDRTLAELRDRGLLV